MDQAIVFGDHEHLVGIVSHPNDPAGQQSKTAAIMLTPGMLHNVGPFRMHVDLARQLSASGIRSLRFDLSGIGESLGIGSTRNSIDRAAAETRDAMDWLEKHHGCKHFVLFGLCSGADDSMHTAISDPRVAGFVAIDGLGFRTRRFYLHRITSHYIPRLLSPRKWMDLANRFLFGGAAVPKTLQTGADVREFPDQEEAERQLQTLVDRGVQMHFVYTGGIADYYNYEDQFFEMLPGVDFRNSISTIFFPQMDHVALLCEDREALVAHVTQKIIEMGAVTASTDQEDEDQPVLLPFVYPVAGENGIVV